MPKPLDPPRDHRIQLPEAAEFTRRWRQHNPPAAGRINSGAYLKDQVLELLNQAGCIGIRIYLGRGAEGAANMVAVGVDADGNDLTQGTILEQVYPCPPFCPDGSALNA